MNDIKNVTIICPLYQAENYILNLDKSLKSQKNVTIQSINYILTESTDKTEDILKDINAHYSKVKKQDFSHSLTRENEVMKVSSYVTVFITQDIVIKDDNWLFNLVAPIFNNECDASYSRQLSINNNIEKYTREHNYPDKSFIVTKADIKEKGLKTFFFSDASSAIKTSIFKKLNGYDQKNLPISEDMYIAYKLIINGYRIKYCSNSIIYHSHNFTLKQLYKRYYDTGVFFKQNSYLDKYGTNSSGGNMAKYIFKRALKEKNINVLIRFFPDMLARYIGMQIGKK